MSSQYYNQNQPPVSYPAPAAAGQGQSAYVAPPPAGYPTRDALQTETSTVPVETRSRGDGFWKGCCAALCCCCVLDACF